MNPLWQNPPHGASDYAYIETAYYDAYECRVANPYARCFRPRLLREIGFIHISENAYYRPKDNVLLGDAAPRNVRFLDERILPFDAVAEQPEGEIQKLCILKAEKYG